MRESPATVVELGPGGVAVRWPQRQWHSGLLVITQVCTWLSYGAPRTPMLGAGLGSVNIWSLCLGFRNVFCSAWGYSRGDSHGIIYIKFRGVI